MKVSFYTALPKTHSYHYLERASQGALICESEKWPKDNTEQAKGRPSKTGRTADYNGYWSSGVEPSFSYGDRSYSADIPHGSKVACAYSDRIHGWDSKRYDAACKIAGTGCQGWASNLPKLSEAEFLRFAAVALNLEDKKVFAARAVHHYNVSNGYSCPTIEAIYSE